MDCEPPIICKALGVYIHFSEFRINPFYQILIRGHDTEDEEPLRYGVTSKCHVHDHRQGGVELL